MHIGRLTAKITPGVFVVENLVIEGLQPADRPFLTAKKIEVVVPWWTILRRQLIVESVEMTDWDMVVETWPSSPAFPRGRHNFPKFTRDSKSNGPKRFTTAVRSVLGDGSYGGWYEQPDEEMLRLWQVGIEETRRAIEAL